MTIHNNNDIAFVYTNIMLFSYITKPYIVILFCYKFLNNEITVVSKSCVSI